MGFFKKNGDTLVFSGFLYFFQTLQYVLTYLDSIENILMLFLYSLGEKRLVYSNKLLPFNMKLINPIKDYPHIIHSYACIL